MIGFFETNVNCFMLGHAPNDEGFCIRCGEKLQIYKPGQTRKSDSYAKVNKSQRGSKKP